MAQFYAYTLNLTVIKEIMDRTGEPMTDIMKTLDPDGAILKYLQWQWQWIWTHRRDSRRAFPGLIEERHVERVVKWLAQVHLGNQGLAKIKVNTVDKNAKRRPLFQAFHQKGQYELRVHRQACEVKFMGKDTSVIDGFRLDKDLTNSINALAFTLLAPLVQLACSIALGNENDPMPRRTSMQCIMDYMLPVTGTDLDPPMPEFPGKPPLHTMEFLLCTQEPPLSSIGDSDVEAPEFTMPRTVGKPKKASQIIPKRKRAMAKAVKIAKRKKASDSSDDEPLSAVKARVRKRGLWLPKGHIQLKPKGKVPKGMHWVEGTQWRLIPKVEYSSGTYLLLLCCKWLLTPPLYTDDERTDTDEDSDV